MEQKILQEKLKKHIDWLNDLNSGERLNLQWANLQGICLQYADLQGANLYHINLKNANLYQPDLRDTNLQFSDLQNAIFYKANLQGANLSNSDLYCANLQCVILKNTNLQGVNLRNANFSLMNLLKVNWGHLSDDLTLECMRQDAVMIGEDKMNEWVKGGKCPYNGRDRDLIFTPKKELWTPGYPKYNIGELIKALCEYKGIKL